MIPRLEIAASTHCGRVRRTNEDAISARADAGFAVLADGMGGHRAGEVASEMAVRVAAEALAVRLSEANAIDAARAQSLATLAVERANTAVFQAGSTQPELQGMGTTIVVGVWHDESVTIAHVGDSRAYRLRSGRLQALTRDHTIVQNQVESGLITAQQARVAAHRNVLTRAVGTDPIVDVDVCTHGVRAGDLYLLCSDGVHDLLNEGLIEATLAPLAGQPQAAAEALVERANAAGGLDNISVILVRVVSPILR